MVISLDRTGMTSWPRNWIHLLLLARHLAVQQGRAPVENTEISQHLRSRLGLPRLDGDFFHRPATAGQTAGAGVGHRGGLLPEPLGDSFFLLRSGGSLYPEWRSSLRSTLPIMVWKDHRLFRAELSLNDGLRLHLLKGKFTTNSLQCLTYLTYAMGPAYHGAAII